MHCVFARIWNDSTIDLQTCWSIPNLTCVTRIDMKHDNSVMFVLILAVWWIWSRLAVTAYATCCPCSTPLVSWRYQLRPARWSNHINERGTATVLHSSSHHTHNHNTMLLTIVNFTLILILTTNKNHYVKLHRILSLLLLFISQ